MSESPTCPQLKICTDHPSQLCLKSLVQSSQIQVSKGVTLMYTLPSLIVEVREKKNNFCPTIFFSTSRVVKKQVNAFQEKKSECTREDCLLLPRLLMLHTSVELGKHRIWLGKNNSNVISLSLDSHSLRMVSQKLFPTTAEISVAYVIVINFRALNKLSTHRNKM